MKIIGLSCVLVAALGMTAPVTAEAVDVAIGNVGVTAVKSQNRNTIVAVSYAELGGAGNTVTVSNLVKTANLTVGDQLVVYKTDGTYETWRLEEVGANKVWTANNATFTLGAGGAVTRGTGVPADQMTRTAGTGLWLVRGDGWDGKEFTFYIYGRPVTGAESTSTAGTWSLVGNPTQSSKTITAAMTPGAAKGDTISVAEKNGFVNYVYKSSGAWKREPVDGTTWGDAPVIEAGKGFWIKTASAVTIQW